jgi:tRNA(Ile)-lysidine synthase
LRGRVAAALAPELFPGAHLAVGLSGGVDSVTLLAILTDLAPDSRFSLRAVHVNHGISRNAASWAEFCAGLCRSLGIPLQIYPVDVSEFLALGLEGAARRARFSAFARVEADFLVLGQHRDDQAETLMLRLLRGSGPQGLASMSPVKTLPGMRAKLLRPLLEASRTEIEDFARGRGLRWIEDESNADIRRRRNFLRHEVFPLIETQFPAARETLARCAEHMGEARELLEELGRSDYDRCSGGEGTVEVGALLQLGSARAKNLLRFWCEIRGVLPPAAAQIAEFLRQLRASGADARPSLAVSAWRFLRHRGRLHLAPTGEALPPEFQQDWNGENALLLPALGGVLTFRPEDGRGLSLAKLRFAAVSVRLRQGGERLRLDPRRPRRTLKNLFRERGVPTWLRERTPLLFCGEELVSVPGIGNACEYLAVPGERGLIVSWEPLG